MTTKNEMEAVLNDVHVTVLAGADYARDSIQHAQDPRLKEVLRALEARRAAQASAVEGHIRQVGLPQMPDPERQLIGRSLTHLKSAFVQNGDVALVEAQQKSDSEIVEACTKALDVDLPEELHRLLGAIVDDVIEHKPELARLDAAFRKE